MRAGCRLSRGSRCRPMEADRVQTGTSASHTRTGKSGGDGSARTRIGWAWPSSRTVGQVGSFVIARAIKPDGANSVQTIGAEAPIGEAEACAKPISPAKRIRVARLLPARSPAVPLCMLALPRSHSRRGPARGRGDLRPPALWSRARRPSAGPTSWLRGSGIHDSRSCDRHRSGRRGRLLVVVPACFASGGDCCCSRDAAGAGHNARPGGERARAKPSGACAFGRGRRLDVVFRVPATILELLVRTNQNLTQGRLLARLDARDFETRLAPASSAVAEAKARFAALQAGAGPMTFRSSRVSPPRNRPDSKPGPTRRPRQPRWPARRGCSRGGHRGATNP